MQTSKHVSLSVVTGVLLAILLTPVNHVLADELTADYIEGERSADLITPEVHAAAATIMGQDNARAFLHAMRLNMLKYDADMQTQKGRIAWHGRFLREEVSTNEMVKVEVYSNTVDGTIWRYKSPFKPKPMVEPLSPARRKTTYTTNGLPARLAAVLVKRAAELDAETVTVTVETTGNAPEESDEPPPAGH